MIGRKDAAAKAAEIRYCPEHRRFMVSIASRSNHFNCTGELVNFHDMEFGYDLIRSVVSKD